MTSTLGRRIFLAHLELSYRLGRRVSNAEFGELVAKQMRRGTPFTAAAVSRWESGTQVPSVEAIEAIAALTGTDPGWISHGERSAAPAPRHWGEQVQAKSADQIPIPEAQRVQREAERVKPKRRRT
jgi:transcriptional regulator with XRE-family HTH domain